MQNQQSQPMSSDKGEKIISQDKTRPNEVTLPPETVKAVTVNIDDIKPNSVLIINIDVENPLQKMAIMPTFSKLFSSHAAKLREKNVTIMIMTIHENINVVSEEEMNAAGWERKDKSLIINPFNS
ncbi:MAG TPA: hypothetical protein PLC59_02370 [Bacteroidales bacterium]|jgi:hypothetical protein|nr:hypothetical protein [Bacteroidales bacterium]